MEFDKKMFLFAASQIKAYKDVVLLRDSESDGCVDILYAPKAAQLRQCVHTMTVRLAASGSGLFDDGSPAGKLNKPVLIYLNRAKQIVLKADVCVFEDGRINGIPVAVDGSDSSCHPLATTLAELRDVYSSRIEAFRKSPATLDMGRDDWAYAVSECAKFESSDPHREFMNGTCFDFYGGGAGFVNIVATDGRKLILLGKAVFQKGASTEKDTFIVPTGYLLAPDSGCLSVRIQFFGGLGRVAIRAEDCLFESLFVLAEGNFPNYRKVIPEITDKTQWFTLCASSFTDAVNSVKSFMDIRGDTPKDVIHINAEDPKKPAIVSVNETQTNIAVKGEASRPMRLSYKWEHLSPSLFDGLPLTKFYLDGSKKATLVLAGGGKVKKGLTLDIVKVLMPVGEDIPGEDEFRIPKAADEGADIQGGDYENNRRG